jgi:UDP-glucose 4-epimerase
VRALVTGGAGFIGSSLVDRLLAEGHAVDVIDDLSSGSLRNLALARSDYPGSFSFHRLDVRRPDVVELVVHRKPDVVFHLAAHTDAPGSLERPTQDAEVNVLGALQVLEGARLAGSRKVVFASSAAAIYAPAEPRDLPITEAHPQRPRSPFGVAKKAVADYLELYRERHGLEFTALALATVYGPRQEPGGEGGVVATFARRLVADEPCVIFGDGRQTRDLVYVDDAVDALARAGERGSGLLVNIGTGVETTVDDLFVLACTAAERVRSATYLPARPGDLTRCCFSLSRAEIHLGWKPWTDIAAGVDATVRWVRDQAAQGA